MLNKIFPVSIILVLLVASLVGCGGEGESINPLELVPKRTGILEYFDLSRIIEDEDVIELYEEQIQKVEDAEDVPQTWDEALDWVKDETGIDLRKPVELLLVMEMPEIPEYQDYGFGQYSGDAPEIYVSYIAKCTVDQTAIIDSLESSMEVVLTTVDHNGYKIYTAPAGSLDNGTEQFGNVEFGLAFIGSDGLIYGTIDAVKDIIDIYAGDETPASGELLDIYNGLGDAIVKSAAVIPPGFYDDALSEMPSEIPLDLTPFFDIKTVASTMDKQGETISLYEQICFGDSDTAEAVEGLIDLGMMMLKLGGLFEGGFGDMLPRNGGWDVPGTNGWDMPGTNGWSTPTPGDMPFDFPIPEIPEEVIELVVDVLGDLLDKLEVDTTGACLDINFDITIAEIEELVEKISAFDTSTLPDWSWPIGGGDEQSYWNDDELLQLACSTFYADTHGGWVEGPPALWGCNDTSLAEAPGHYYPTTLERPGDHVLDISWTEYDPLNDLNQLVCLEDGFFTPATDADIDDHAIWMGLLLNEAGEYTSQTGISDRMYVSPLINEGALYITDIPESAGTMNGVDAPGGSYTWIVVDSGNVYGVYKGIDGKWYWGFNETYP